MSKIVEFNGAGESEIIKQLGQSVCIAAGTLDQSMDGILDILVVTEDGNRHLLKRIGSGRSNLVDSHVTFSQFVTRDASGLQLKYYGSDDLTVTVMDLNG